jgi:hypothetical protein
MDVAPERTGPAMLDLLTQADWEAPAGGASVAVPRVGPFAYTYRGDADAHLANQPCQPAFGKHVTVVQADYVVDFACGCRAAVPGSSLARR